MRVEKIDIKKEFVDVRDGVSSFDWIEKPKKFTNFIHNPTALIPESESYVKYKTYNIVEVVDDNYNTRFVGVEQEQLFQDILNISNSSLESIKINSYNEGLSYGYNNAYFHGKKDSIKIIKNINWFRRLFKLF